MRISQSYTAKGALWKVTGHEGQSRTVANQVEFKYTPWGQVSEDRQEHSGAAGPSSPSVNYGFRTNGTAPANDINPLWVMYPSGSKTNYLYGTADTDNHKLGRMESLKVWGESSDLVTYQYCGLDRFVKMG